MNQGKQKKVAVIGLWHLGCTVSAGLAKVGWEVLGLDFEKKVIEALKKGRLPIVEKGLTGLTKKMSKKGNLQFSVDFKKLKEYKYIVIAFDTPVNDKDQPDLAVIQKAIKKVGQNALNNSTVIIMSQVPAGTSRQFFNKLKKKLKGVEVVYNPENLRLSQAIETFLNADRQIIGLSSPRAKKRLAQFYSFYKKPLLFMSLESAELVKHGINSFLATSVSFINQLADLSEAVNADILDVVRGMKSDTRIGQKAFLAAGLGFAGGTLGRDLKVLESLSKKYKLNLSIIKDVYKANRYRKLALFQKIKCEFKNLKGRRFTLLGLVYKPGTNTMRRSLSMEIAKWLSQQKAVVKGYDPALKYQGQKLSTYIEIFSSPYKAAKGSDCIIIITEWPEFKKINYGKMVKGMRKRIIFDTKNILHNKNFSRFKLKYFGTGVSK